MLVSVMVVRLWSWLWTELQIMPTLFLSLKNFISCHFS